MHARVLPYLVSAAHGVQVLGVPEEDLELQHLVQPVPLVLPGLLQLRALSLQISQTVPDLRRAIRNGFVVEKVLHPIQ